MRRLRPTLLLLPLLAVLAGCGTQDVQLSSSDPNYAGAEVFNARCSGCHSLKAAGTQGSASNIRHREYKDGPNFNQRKEDYQQILYALRNGGFSSGPMPQNIVTGREAEQVAKFVEKYSGKQSGGKTQSASPGNAPAAGRQ
jgi:mono/diheme cytochrome c family protein